MVTNNGLKQDCQPALNDKKTRLIRILKKLNRLAVALSGGVDSGLLLAVARDVLGDRVIAVTARSPIHPQQDLADAARLAAQLEVPHWIVDTDEWRLEAFVGNPPDRCYLCKKSVFSKLSTLVRERGFSHLAHGANADDCADYRPGLKAATELGVLAPLMDAGLTKAEIRSMAKSRGLFVWDKPAMACLASRFPYGTPITVSRLDQVKRAEQFLRDAGLNGFRVRYHGDVARIELPLDQLPKIIVAPLRAEVVDRLRELGFLHVCVDLEGYVTGSLNRTVADEGGPNPETILTLTEDHDRSAR